MGFAVTRRLWRTDIKTNSLVFMRVLWAAVLRIDYVHEEMEAGSHEEATAMVQVGNDGGGASKWLFISFCSHSRHLS